MKPYSQDLLQKISASLEHIDQVNLLGNSLHQLNLLNYLVTEELAGRGEEVTAYNIGIEVLGKDADFDPNRNTSVRVEMLRLRRSLSIYNSSLPPDCVAITIPKRSYQPVFEDANQNAYGQSSHMGDNEGDGDKGHNIPIYAKKEQRTYLEKRDIAVIAGIGFLLLLLGWSLERSFFGNILGGVSHIEECSIERPLLRIQNTPHVDGENNFGSYMLTLLEFEVEKTMQSYPLVVVVRDFPDCGYIPGYILKLNLEEMDNSYLVTANIFPSNGDDAIWKKEYTVTKNDQENLGSIAYVISYDLASFDRFLPQHAARENWESNALKVKYLCVLDSYHAFSNWPYSYRREGTHCLSEYAETEGHYADIPALYAIYLYYVQMGIISESVQNVEAEFEDMLNRSRLMNGTDPIYLYAYLLAESQDIDEGYHEMSRTLEWIMRQHGKNPVIVMHASLGGGVFLGNWQTADTLIQNISPFLVNIEELDIYKIHYLMVERDFESAFEDVRLMREDKSALLDIFKLSIYGHLQREDLIRAKRRQLANRGMYSLDQIDDVVGKMRYHNSLLEPLTEGLQMAFAVER